MTTVRTGDAVTFRISYVTTEPLEDLVVGFAIHSVDGTQVTGPNTRDQELVLHRPATSGSVDLKIPALMLVRGIYDVSTSIFDYACLHPYDFRHRSFRFDVEIAY